MSRKSRERMMRGAAEARPGQVVYGHTGGPKPSPWQSVPRAKLMRIMREASESDREGVRQRLRKDGSPKALALLEEFERQWGD